MQHRMIKDGILYYNGYNLLDLAKKYGTPLKITFLDVIKEHVLLLKNTFDKSIQETNYNGKFFYLNANKANYSKEEIYESYLYSDGLETSSYYDLLLTAKMMENDKKKLIVSNGIKEDDYLDKIIELHQDGYNIIDIIDSKEEYLKLKEKNIDLNVGLRVHLSSKYHGEGESEILLNDRFGINHNDLDFIISDLKNTKMHLNTIHYHQRGFDYVKGPFLKNFMATIDIYEKAIKAGYPIDNLDIGGGTPLPIEENFDYDNWTKFVLNTLKDECHKRGIKEPNIIIENGKFSQKDSTVNIYKVISIKDTENEYPWYTVNGSLLIALPEMIALGEPILVMPINGLDKLTKKGALAGMTCDCDDVLLDNHQYFNLPDEKEIYIGCIGTGSYQNSMNGKGGIHHCLLPEEKDIVIKDGKEYIRHDLQSIEDIYKLIKM